MRGRSTGRRRHVQVENPRTAKPRRSHFIALRLMTNLSMDAVPRASLENRNMSRQQRTRVKHIKALLEPDEVRGLLLRLCIEYGFCLPPIEIEKLAASPPTDIDEFTEAALVAEGYGFTNSDALCNKARELLIIWLLQQATRCCGQQLRAVPAFPAVLWVCRTAVDRIARSEPESGLEGRTKPNNMASVASQLWFLIRELAASTTYWGLLKQPDNQKSPTVRSVAPG